MEQREARAEINRVLLILGALAAAALVGWLIVSAGMDARLASETQLDSDRAHLQSLDEAARTLQSPHRP